jgi:CTD kinase subunit gamma
MSFDAFEARLHFLQLLRRLNASQQSIQAVVSYAVKYGRRCGEDLWECIMEETAKVSQRRKAERLRNSHVRLWQGSLNARINIFYMLDTLCDPITSANSLPSTSSAGAGPSSGRVAELPYAGFLERDLETLVGCVVPEGKEGMLNLLSAKQVSLLLAEYLGECGVLTA